MLPNTNRVLYLFSFSFHGLKLFLLEYRFNGIDEFLHGSLERRDAHARQTVLVGVQVCCVDSSTDQLHQYSPHCDNFAARFRCLVQPTHVGEKVLQVWRVNSGKKSRQKSQFFWLVTKIFGDQNSCRLFFTDYNFFKESKGFV